MSGSELSSTFSETLIRMQVKTHVRLANDSGGPAVCTFIWSADNPDGIIFVTAMGGRAETRVFGHDLLKRGMFSPVPIGDGLVTVQRSATMVRVQMTAPRDSDQWMRISLSVTDVARALAAIDARMLNVERPDIEAAFHHWMSEEDGA